MPDAALASSIVNLWPRMVIGIQGDREALTFAADARATIAALDPALAISDVQTIQQLERDRSAPQRFSATVIAGFGVGALLLAAIGLYGVLAFSVSQRRREIAVRLALGAPRSDVLQLTVRDGMMLVPIGLVIGGIGAVATSRLLRATLFKTDVHDPLTFVTVPYCWPWSRSRHRTSRRGARSPSIRCSRCELTDRPAPAGAAAFAGFARFVTSARRWTRVRNARSLGHEAREAQLSRG